MSRRITRPHPETGAPGALPDHVRPGLRVLFVGINPGLRSASTGHHYAGRGNRFWSLMYDSGLLPERLSAERDAEVLQWGYGLTNIVARATSGVAGLGAGDFERGRRALLQRIRAVRPAVVALVGLTVYERLRPALEDAPRESGVGLRRTRVHGARVFVLPNPSGRNTHFTYAQMLTVYRRLARLLTRMESAGEIEVAEDASPSRQRRVARTTLPRRSRARVRKR